MLKPVERWTRSCYENCVTRVLLRPEAENFIFQFFKMFSPWTEMEKQKELGFLCRRGFKENQNRIFLFCFVGCAARRRLSAGRRLNWQDASNLTAQGLASQSAPSLERQGPHLLFCIPFPQVGCLSAFLLPSYPSVALEARAAGSGLSQGCGISQISFPGDRAGRERGCEPGGRSHLQQRLEGFLFKLHFLPRKWSLWGVLRNCCFHIHYRKLTYFSKVKRKHRKNWFWNIKWKIPERFWLIDRCCSRNGHICGNVTISNISGAHHIVKGKCVLKELGVVTCQRSWEQGYEPEKRTL